MKNMLQFIPVQLTVFLILGILFGYYIFIIPFHVLMGLLGLLIGLGIAFYHANMSFSKKGYFNILSYILCFFLGISSISIKKEIYDTSHYSHYVSDRTSSILIIREVLKPSLYHIKYIAEVCSVNLTSVIGKVLLNVEKDSTSQLKVDDRLFVKTKFEDINFPSNPYYFNYNAYMQNQQVYHQLFVKAPEILKLKTEKISLRGMAASFRDKANKALKENNFKDDELGVINALLLGQRQEISKELLEAYANAGAIHILAVSGLHVGIVLLILNFLFKPLEGLKNGKTIKLILVIGFLWIFAIVAGLSASVVRAVTMFSAVVIGVQVNRPTNIYNTLVMSMFILLLIQPYFLFDVGFQLSYVAVFSIVSIQPLIYKTWSPKLKVIDYFWKLFSVSLAAQLGVLPLSLYYFHQFPGLFFLSNLVIIPILGLILMVGILAIFLSLLDVLPAVLSELYSELLQLMNSFIRWISLREDFLFENISFSFLILLASYGLLVFGVRFIENFKAKRMLWFLSFVLFFQSVLIFEKSEVNRGKEFVVFQKSRNSIIGDRLGKQITVYHSMDSSQINNERILQNYRLGVGEIEIVKSDTIPRIHQFGEHMILIVDSLGIYQFPKFNPSVVVLRQSPKLNLERLLGILDPVIVVVDGSNYKSYVQHWKEICMQRKTPFHDTSKKGAYILK
tara:strand:- start:111541 stop:113571 length:2031 start_codon:yes stop_codon:yes gene_type:complete